MYSILIKETSWGEIAFDTLEEAKEWSEHREGDINWYRYEEDDLKLLDKNEKDISKEVDWL